MKHSNLFAIVGVGMLFAMSLVSCSEDDGKNNEYANWQNRNEAFFNGIYNQAQDSIKAGNTSWKIIKSVFKSDSVSTKPTDHIVVKVLSNGTGTESPLQTDSVVAHYMGYFFNTSYVSAAQVSSDYTYGKVFDSSWTGTYNLASMYGARFYLGNASNIIDGFSTALQHMHAKDRWLVYIPYQLGYGTKEQSGIPIYSTLIFDLTLDRFSRKGYPLD